LDVNNNGVIGITVENSQGIPVPVFKPTVINVNVSEIGVINLKSSLTLGIGEFSGFLNYTAVSPGETSVTASTTGLASGAGAVVVESKSSPVESTGSIPLTLSMIPEPSSIALNQQGVLQFSLLNVNGYAVPAPAPVTVLLFSSEPENVSVPQSVTISKGTLFVDVPFTALGIGTSEITATTNGVNSVTQTVSVAPSLAEPNGISLSVAPSTIPANGTSYQVVFVSLLEGGAPAVALQPLNISLATSNTNVGSVAPFIVIPANHEYAIAEFTTSLVTGSTTITAAATGVASSQAALLTHSSTELAVTLTPFATDLPTGEKGINVLGVSIVSQTGSSVPLSVPTTVYLNSTDSSIISVPSKVVIPGGSDFVMIPLTTNDAGNVIIEATSSGYQSSSITMSATTVGPYQAALYIAPADSLSLNGVGNGMFVIQLQDSNGDPVSTTSVVSLSIVPSNFVLYNKTVPIQIEPGQTEAIYSAPFLGSGNSSFSLSGSGLHLPSAVTAYNTIVTPSVSFGYSPQPTVYTKSSVTTNVVVSLGGVVLQGVKTVFGISGVNYTETTNSAGMASVTFQSPRSAGPFPITVYVSNPLFGSLTKSFSVFITPRPNIYLKFTWPPEIILGVPPQISLSATVLIVIGVVAAVGVYSWKVKGSLFFIKKKKASGEGEEEDAEYEAEDDSEES
jgi:hypothetical protein